MCLNEKFWILMQYYLVVGAISWSVLLHYGRACENSNHETFLCKQCGETIASAIQLKHFPSNLALKQLNQTLLGVKNVPVQLFQNPQKRRFNVVTLRSGNIQALEETYSDATWFPGFSWRISVCPKCGYHLGWKYQPINFNHVTHSEHETFIGLILENILEEHASDTLLIVPQSYKS